MGDTVRMSQANLRALANPATGHAMKIDGFFSGPRGAARQRRRAPSCSSRNVDNLVEDILNSNPSVASRPRRGMRDDKGMVKQTGREVRSSAIYDKIRASRQRTSKMQPSGSGTTEEARLALQRQVSTKLPRFR